MRLHSLKLHCSLHQVIVSLLTVTECRNDMQLVLSTSGINGYSSLEYSLSYSTEYSTPNYSLAAALIKRSSATAGGARDAICQSKIGIRDDGIAANTAMITVHRAQQNLQHCQKSTSSRYYRLTRLHVCSIDSIDRLDLSRLCRSTRLQRLSMDSIDRLDRFEGLTDGTGLEVLCFVVVRLSIRTFSRK